MALRAKYQQLIDAANQSGVTNLQVREQGDVVYIDGNAPSEQVTKNLWYLYNKIDSDYRAGDLVLNVNVCGGEEAKTVQEYEVVKGDNLTKIGKKYGIGWKEIYEANK